MLIILKYCIIKNTTIINWQKTVAKITPLIPKSKCFENKIDKGIFKTPINIDKYICNFIFPTPLINDEKIELNVLITAKDAIPIDNIKGI